MENVSHVLIIVTPVQVGIPAFVNKDFIGQLWVLTMRAAQVMCNSTWVNKLKVRIHKVHTLFLSAYFPIPLPWDLCFSIPQVISDKLANIHSICSNIHTWFQFFPHIETFVISLQIWKSYGQDVVHIKQKPKSYTWSKCFSETPYLLLNFPNESRKFIRQHVDPTYVVHGTTNTRKANLQS